MICFLCNVCPHLRGVSVATYAECARGKQADDGLGGVLSRRLFRQQTQVSKLAFMHVHLILTKC